MQHAHGLFDKGKYLQAAQAYGNLAKHAASMGLERAPTLYLQAGRARILGGETDAGLQLVRRAFHALLQAAAYSRFLATRARVVDELTRLGLTEEAESLQDELGQLIQGVDEPNLLAAPEVDLQRKVLPVKCPYCGANLFPDEVEEHHAGYQLCGYCGSRVEVE